MIKIQKLHCDFPQYKDLVDAYISPFVIIPLKNADGKVCTSKVSENTRVSEGEIIAQDTKSSSAIHSTVPGIVTGFRTVSIPDGKKTNAIIIKTDGSFSYLGRKLPVTDWKNYSANDIWSLMYDKGVVSTFDKTCSMASVLKDFTEKRDSSSDSILAVRLFDSDPTVRTGEFLSERKLDQIIEGAAIVARSIAVHKIAFIVSERGTEIKEKVRNFFESLSDEWFVFKAATDTYPFGGYRELKMLLKKNRCKFEDMMAIDAETAFTTYEAVALNKPVLEKFVQFSGSPLVSERMFRVRIGTPIRKLVEECGGLKQSVYKIVINGLIKGTAVSDLDTPVTADLRSVTFLPKKIIPFQKQVNCIRCGNCHRVCPKKLQVDKLFSYYYFHTEINQKIIDTSSECTECGVCDTACPARLPLAQTISLLKGGNQ